MSPPNDPKEKVGERFDPAAMNSAQAKAWTAVRAVAKSCKPGMTEKDAAVLLKEALAAAGIDKIWHPPQIRFGKNTTKPFAVPGDKTIALQSNDIFFLDIGPVFEGYESDVGETFVVGNDPDQHRIAADSKAIFQEVQRHWRESGESGPELYRFAETAAEKRGWRISFEGASGHRISEFPHSVHWRGKLKTFESRPSPDRWILEIHLLHPEGHYGAFFEDLL
ncbi:MAG: M24 family metallopeptidase [Bdellovibrionota bacterium]